MSAMLNGHKAAGPARLVLQRVDREADEASFARDVRRGLSAARKFLPCQYLYDARGSRLFDEITTLEGYYPPRAEREIITRHRHAIASQLVLPCELVELGSGSSEKTAVLIEALLRREPRLRYIPIDVSPTALERAGRRLMGEHPGLEIHALVGDYEAALRHLPEREGRTRLFAWLGSSIGNLDRAAAAAFLRGLPMDPDDRAFVGIDLRKDADVLQLAYDDPAGITAAFIANVLVRINRELDADFEVDAFSYRAVYERDEGRVVMSLVARSPQRVTIRALELEVRLARGESIHVENSYKYAPDEIDSLAREAGLVVLDRWVDSQERFSDVLFARKTDARSPG